MLRLELGRHRQPHRLGQRRVVHVGPVVLQQDHRGGGAARLVGDRLEHLHRLLALDLPALLRAEAAAAREQLLVQRLLQPGRQRLDELFGQLVGGGA